MMNEDVEILDDKVIESDNEIQEVTLPTLTYAVTQNRIIGKVDNLEAMRQAIGKILLTDRFDWEIYSEQYGHDLSELIGKEMPYVEAEVERMITEALSGDDRVDEVNISHIKQIDRNKLLVSLTVNTMFGSVMVESEVIV